MTVASNDRTCALCGEPPSGSEPGVPVLVDDPERPWPMHVHAACLTTLLAAGIAPRPARLGRIPGDAACGVCGKRLPIVGRHPFALTIVEADPGRSWFIHAECFPASLRARMVDA